jgi:gamma-glutamyltranspeptidase/glutathione hydrolase
MLKIGQRFFTPYPEMPDIMQCLMRSDQYRILSAALPVALLLTLFPEQHMLASDRPIGQRFATRSEAMAPSTMAATSQPLATQAALDIMRQGGNAIDAAIAANAVLGAVEPTGAGIGGDMFAILWDHETEKLYGYNGSGRSPKSLALSDFKELGLDKIPAKGPLPVSVPGCVDGWFALHQKFGRLPMDQILQPAIHYARDGFPVTEVIAYHWEAGVNAFKDQPGFLETFTIDGRAPKKGEIFRNPMLARTLTIIAENGRDAFYKGEPARTIDRFMKRIGGFLSYDDLAEHAGEWVDPVSTNYRGCEVWELPPNGQGIATLQMLNILEGYDLRSMGLISADYAHLFIEAKKVAFEDRAHFYADMDFADVPVQELISKEYAAERRRLIDIQKAATSYPHGHPTQENGDTVYLTVADADRNMVSLIQSNFRGHGSGVCPDGLGFCLQNRGELFTFEEGHANQYAPGKRPFHTIIPAFITRDGKPWVSFGVMGGATQPQGQVQIVVNLIDFGLNLQEAGDAPRIVHVYSSQPTGEQMTDGGAVALESGYGEEIREELARRGHRLVKSGYFGGYQAIMYDAENDCYIGASESRKDGHAAGY